MKKIGALATFLLIFCILQISAYAQPYLVENASWQKDLEPIQWSSLALGDIDNNGFPDLVSIGKGDSGITSRIYTNNGTGFQVNTSWQNNLTNVHYGSIAMGDVDNDGDLDLVSTGCSSGGGYIDLCDDAGFQSLVYINNGTCLVENSSWQSNLSKVWRSSIALGDIDNDGDLDMVLTGQAIGGRVSKIYTNNGSSFVENTTWQSNLIELDSSAAVFVDFNDDGNLDLILSGEKSTSPYHNTRVYVNNGTTFIENVTWQQNLMTARDSSISVGDIDSDGDMDLSLIGCCDIHRTYNNTGKTFTEIQKEITHFAGVFAGSISFGDYNNDGQLDMATTGREKYTSVYSNNGNGIFTDYWGRPEQHLLNLEYSSLVWGDIDNDYDLDLVLTGWGGGGGGWYRARVYTNNISTSNILPNPPTSNLNNSFNSSTGKLTLSWTNGSDAETPTLGLYYNLRVGTCSGCHDVVSGVYGGGDDNGYFGNMMQRKAITLNRPDLANKTVYWAVQTIDTGLAKSAWSTEQVYVIGTCAEDWSYSDWSSCVGETQTRTAIDLNSCGTTDNRSSLSQSCTSPSGPSGPSGPPPSPTDPSTATKELSSIQAGAEESFMVNRANVSITEIRIRASEEVSQASMTITRKQGNPVTAEPGSRVYQYIEIIHENLEGKLSEVEIMFAVDPAWINDSDVNASTVALNRFVNGSWERLATRLKEGYEYESTSSGLSYFAITGDENLPVICNESDTRCGKTGVDICLGNGTFWELIEECPYGCDDATCLEVICEAGLLRCNGSVVEQCNIVRWIELEECEFQCENGRCVVYSSFLYVVVAGIVIVAAGGLASLILYRKRKRESGA